MWMDPPTTVIERELNKVGASLSDMRELWKRSDLRKPIADGLVKNIEKRGAPIRREYPKGWFEGWKRNRPEGKKYSKRKRKSGHGSKPLHVTGDLKAAAGSYTPIRATRTTLEMGIRGGSMGARAADMQWGKKYAFVGWSKKMTEAAHKATFRWINDLLGLAKRRIDRGTGRGWGHRFTGQVRKL